MGTDKGFRTIHELVSGLTKVEHGLTSGTLGPEDLETACNDARELYERLVVLRHKAREARSARQRSTPEPAPTAAMSEEAGDAPPSLRLDTRPPLVSPRQTSLIEAIEGVEEPTAPPAKAAVKSPATVAEKLEKASIPDLSKAISLSHKFWFVAELFGGDRIAYDKSIGLLNAMNDKEKAMAFMETEVVAKMKKTADQEALSAFMDLLDRRFP